MSSSNKIKLPEDGSVENALNAFRGNGSDEADRFIVLGYEENSKNVLCVVASGDGGLAEAKEHLLPDKCRYTLLRKFHKVEMANTVKFAYIDWTPDTLKPMRKGLVSTHKGQVEDLLKPYHVSLQASDAGDLDENVIMQKIGFTSGTANYVTKKAAGHGYSEQKAPTQERVASVSGVRVASGVTANRKLTLEDEEAINDAVKAVKDDKSPITWALVGYTGDSTLHLVGSGEDEKGVEGLAAALKDDGVYYGLFRHTEEYDKSTLVRFGFVKLLSDSLSPVKKAKYSTHKGFVQTVFEPYHEEFTIANKAELTYDLVSERIQSTMGTKSNVMDAAEAKVRIEQQNRRSSQTQSNLVPVASGASIDFEDKDAFDAAIKEVRNDASETTWALFSYVSKNTLGVKSTGTGGVDAFVNQLEDDNINFALLRVTEQIDKSTTVKFAYILWQPASVAPMKKSQISTKKGIIDKLFAPYHVDFFIEKRDEISTQLVLDKVAAASGTKVNLTDRSAGTSKK